MLAANDADDLAVRKALAERHLARGTPPTAEKWANECLYIDVYDPTVHVLLADALSAGKKYAEAIEEYHVALDLKAKKPNDLKVKLAKAQLGKGDRDAAKATLDGILKEDPEHPEARALREEIEIARRAGNEGERGRWKSLVKVMWNSIRHDLVERASYSTGPVGLTVRAPRPTDNPPPNVVLIIADDMGWTDYGFMGHPQIRTPRLDRLAGQSLAFRRGYVTTSLCSPSLASILTGRYPHQHKITSNDPPLPPGMDERAARRDPRFLAARQEMIKAFDTMPTLPRLLAPKGYLSFQAGKWWGGSYKRGGFTHGMTHGDPARGGRHGDAGLAIGRQGIKPHHPLHRAGPHPQGPVLRLVRADDAPPAAQPARAPAGPLPRQGADRARSPSTGRCASGSTRPAASCSTSSTRRSCADNTLVIFLADNGWIQDPQADRYAPRSKQSPYDGGLRTPILVRWPGKVVAPHLRHPRQRDRRRAHDPRGRRRSSPRPAWRASTCWTRRPSPGDPPSSARSSPTTPSTSTTRPRASAIAGPSRATGS